jgi:hypothetical protein
MFLCLISTVIKAMSQQVIIGPCENAMQIKNPGRKGLEEILERSLERKFEEVIGRNFEETLISRVRLGRLGRQAK